MDIKVPENFIEWAKKYKPYYVDVLDGNNVKHHVEVNDFEYGAIKCGAMKIEIGPGYTHKYIKGGKVVEKVSPMTVYKIITMQKNPQWEDSWSGTQHFRKEMDSGRTEVISKYIPLKFNQYEDKIKQALHREVAKEKDWEGILSEEA